MMNTPTRLRQLADRMGLDGFAEELREIAVELDAKAAPAVPGGWKLVPVEMTDEMRDAGNEFICNRYLLKSAYTAMLAAAPDAPSQEPAVPLELCPTCGEDRPFSGTCGTSDSDTRALCKRKCKPSQEPINRPQNCGTSYCSCIECVCEPPQPVTLTDEDICECFGIDGADDWVFKGAHAIIAALREKQRGV